MILLLYSSILETLFVGFEPEPTSQLLVLIEYEYLGRGYKHYVDTTNQNFTSPEQPAGTLRDMSIFKE